MSSDVLVRALAIQPGIHETSCARWPSENDFACGFQVARSLGTRSSRRRVLAISCSNSGLRSPAMLIVPSSIEERHPGARAAVADAQRDHVDPRAHAIAGRIPPVPDHATGADLLP